VQLAPDGSLLRLRLSWGPPLQGWAVDELRLQGYGELRVVCSACVEGGEPVRLVAVYRRQHP
jgi:hypothetical protein